ncbi:hypothetical protein AB0N14_13725 [Streptomyces sp. NPDC051104]|uniref:hypothetical protein n=1 Tax=Streptomyces sp. NPDC051104 TaxID=3155044 RepID=UPI00342AE763
MPKNTVPGIIPEGPTYNVVDVTPDLAEKWLSQNTHNRNLRDRAVAAYARDMQAGNWTENGESIKFAKDGTLLDGQHRLWAITEAGVSVRMLVVTGLDHTDQETMDAGRKRSLSDALHLRGETNSSILGSILRRTLMWEHGSYRNSGTYTPTNTECLTFLEEHPEVRESVQVAAALRKPSKLPASVLGLTHWLFSRIHAEDAAWFFDKLGTGANLDQYHPVWTLRRRAELADQNTGRVPEDMLLACVIKAWNAYRDGQQIKVLAFKPGGANPEKFPQPK